MEEINLVGLNARAGKQRGIIERVRHAPDNTSSVVDIRGDDGSLFCARFDAVLVDMKKYNERVEAYNFGLSQNVANSKE